MDQHDEDAEIDYFLKQVDDEEFICIQEDDLYP